MTQETKERIAIGRALGMIFKEYPMYNGDEENPQVIWRLQFGYPPEGNWENNEFMKGRAGEVRRVSNEDAMKRIENKEEWENHTPYYHQKLEEILWVVKKLMNKPCKELGITTNLDEFANYPAWPQYLYNLSKIVSGTLWTYGGEQIVWAMLTAEAKDHVKCTLETLDIKI